MSEIWIQHQFLSFTYIHVQLVLITPVQTSIMFKPTVAVIQFSDVTGQGADLQLLPAVSSLNLMMRNHFNGWMNDQ